jgi:hypothetical protein
MRPRNRVHRNFGGGGHRGHCGCVQVNFLRQENYISSLEMIYSLLSAIKYVSETLNLFLKCVAEIQLPGPTLAVGCSL